MDESAFWDLVERCYNRNQRDPRRRARLLGGKLRALPPEEILSFRGHWIAASRRAYTWPLWDAACVLYGQCGPDEFRQVRDWLISHGRSTLERTLADPDRLVELDLDEEAVFSEEYEDLADRVYAEVCGVEAHGPLPELDDPPIPGQDGVEPTGPALDLNDAAAVRARFPLLSATNDAVRALMASVFPPVELATGPCPTCGQPLARHVIGRTVRDEAGGDDAQEVARCRGCRALCWRRVGEREWRPGPDDGELQRRFDYLDLRTR